MNKKVKTAATILGSAAVGAGLGVLFAPKSGKETRKELKVKIDELVSKAKKLNVEDIQKYVIKKTNAIEKAIKELDKEKVLSTAKKKALKIEKDAKELVDYVKTKGEKNLEVAANEVHEKAISATKSVLAKLEEK